MVFRSSEGRWYLKTSASGYADVQTIDWGLSGDAPVPGDYDGDGFAEPAYFRAGDGFYARSLGRLYVARPGTQVIQDR